MNPVGRVNCFRGKERSFTIVEAMVSIAVMTLFGVSVYWALTQLNKQAMTSRLYTAALVAAQSKIDYFQNMSTNDLLKISATGTRTVETVSLYSDPQAITNGTMQVTVSGTMTTTMTITGSLNVSGSYYYKFYTGSVNVQFYYPTSNTMTRNLTLCTLRTDAP